MPARKKTHQDLLVRVPVELHMALKAQAAMQDRPVVQIVREALWAYVERPLTRKRRTSA